MARERKLYLDGLKGIACLLIMLGHFSGIYKYAIDALEIECSFLKSFSILPISILTAESFWLYLFFAISGYLVASSSVLDIWDVLRKAAVRVIRFLLPVIGVVVIVFLLQIGIGFHNQELKLLIDNPWYFASYQSAFTLKDLVLEPIKVFVLGSSKFDSPLWVMRDMLLASLLIYGIICMTKSDKPVVIRGGGYVLTGVTLLICVIVKRYVVFGCLCGACGKWLEYYLQKIPQKGLFAWVMTLALIGAFFLNNTFITAIVFSSWIVMVEGSSISRFFSNKVTVWLGTISLGIFVLHWPIYNSIGAFMIKQLYGSMSNGVLFALTFTVTSVIVVIGSVAFKMTVERYTSYVCSKVDCRIKKLCSRSNVK